VNASFYASHPIYEQQHNKGAFSCPSNAFAMCLSDIALNALQKDDPSTAVVGGAFNNSINHQWSSFLCLLSLSSVLKLPIESYFATPVNSSPSKDSLSLMFNCIILPRETEAPEYR
jgi:hypothetical protein